MTLPLLALFLLSLFLTYHFLLHPLLLSPLSRIPSAHWSSPLWILYLRRRGRPNATIHALHLKYGPLLRLGPNELSVNCVDGGIRTVYGGGYEKGDWYAVFRNYGVSNVFSSASRGEHSARKRMLSNVYAKTTLLGSGTLKAAERRVVGERLVPFLRGANIEDWVMGLCDAAERIFPNRVGLNDGDRAVVYDQLRTMMKKSQGEGPEVALTANERLEIASELLDHVAAGFDTTGITLTYLAWELSKPSNLEIQQQLRRELQGQQAQVDGTEGAAILDLKELDNLPVLNAAVIESLRLHASIPGIQPRVTPPNAELGPSGKTVKGIPAGVRINSQAYSLHLNEDIFPDAAKWEPRRWLTPEGQVDTGGEKSRWFWAFSSGGRMCIGSNLAMLEMKSIVAAIWGNFATSMADDRGMAHNDGYTSEPQGTPDGAYLRLRFAAGT
ncbi:hypothetical protein KVT40_005368 [Elsinoe batatas]|uniref:Cytochrome P450 n=1 Tax=Elsinoe batatas TaxID=2601811 RepID=A0A8K0L629_9PEZI|nr:hypothetical protein KVT40_005368 [Elsinoe batatas]